MRNLVPKMSAASYYFEKINNFFFFKVSDEKHIIHFMELGTKC